ncbi:MAG: carbon monoxide dehydrogenase subunit G [Deltaproteobacteria bacterium]|nr:carbon monoxide dehydrogenase subunit G [Deltaproteobacteria bacterium]
MILEGQFKLAAPIQQVWDSLLNPEVLAACVPGCEKVAVIDERTYDCVVAAKVGSISARFKFTTRLTDIDPPKHLKATGRGDELGKAATFTQETVIDLAETSTNEVQVSYRANVSIVGKLATFGDRIMKAKAAQVQEEFTRSLAKRLSDQTMAPATAGETVAPVAAGASAAPATTGESVAPATTGASVAPAAAGESAAPAAAGESAALATPGRSVALATPGRSVAITGTPALKVSIWEMIAVFFAVLWDKIKSIFTRSKR